jgi:hypothetical protein
MQPDVTWATSAHARRLIQVVLLFERELAFVREPERRVLVTPWASRTPKARDGLMHTSDLCPNGC